MPLKLESFTFFTHKQSQPFLLACCARFSVGSCQSDDEKEE
jgi:hypothetical protein